MYILFLNVLYRTLPVTLIPLSCCMLQTGIYYSKKHIKIIHTWRGCSSCHKMSFIWYAVAVNWVDYGAVDVVHGLYRSLLFCVCIRSPWTECRLTSHADQLYMTNSQMGRIAYVQYICFITFLYIFIRWPTDRYTWANTHKLNVLWWLEVLSHF